MVKTFANWLTAAAISLALSASHYLDGAPL